MAFDPASVLAAVQPVGLPVVYIASGVILGHYVPKAWTFLAAIGSNVKAVYNVGKLVVANQTAAAPVPAAILPPHIATAVAAVAPPPAA